VCDYRQDLLTRAERTLGIVVQTGIVDRYGRAPRQVLRHSHVIGRQFTTRFGQERHGAQQTSTSDQWSTDRRVQPQASQDSETFRISFSLFQQRI
jgi:hypothetical protein